MRPDPAIAEASTRPQSATTLDAPVSELLTSWQQRSLRTTFAGVQMIKNPLDAWVLQELIFEIRPKTVIEVGCFRGGTLLYLATLLDVIGAGRVVGVDKRPQLVDGRVLEHPRVDLVGGRATEVVDEVATRVAGDGPVMVIEDSNHIESHTLEVCRAYGELVTVGSYLVVEDTGLAAGPGSEVDGGPAAAVSTFLAEDGRFVADRSCESFGVTLHPGGWLRRTR